MISSRSSYSSCVALFRMVPFPDLMPYLVAFRVRGGWPGLGCHTDGDHARKHSSRNLSPRRTRVGCRVGRVFTRPTGLATAVGLVKDSTHPTCLRGSQSNSDNSGVARAFYPPGLRCAPAPATQVRKVRCTPGLRAGRLPGLRQIPVFVKPPATIFLIAIL